MHPKSTTFEQYFDLDGLPFHLTYDEAASSLKLEANLDTIVPDQEIDQYCQDVFDKVSAIPALARATDTSDPTEFAISFQGASITAEAFEATRNVLVQHLLEASAHTHVIPIPSHAFTPPAEGKTLNLVTQMEWDEMLNQPIAQFSFQNADAGQLASRLAGYLQKQLQESGDHYSRLTEEAGTTTIRVPVRENQEDPYKALAVMHAMAYHLSENGLQETLQNPPEQVRAVPRPKLFYPRFINRTLEALAASEPTEEPESPPSRTSLEKALFSLRSGGNTELAGCTDPDVFQLTSILASGIKKIMDASDGMASRQFATEQVLQQSRQQLPASVQAADTAEFASALLTAVAQQERQPDNPRFGG